MKGWLEEFQKRGFNFLPCLLGVLKHSFFNYQNAAYGHSKRRPQGIYSRHFFVKFSETTSFESDFFGNVRGAEATRELVIVYRRNWKM